MGQEIELLKSVCQRLEQARISYMLTGSLAAHFYSVPRMTRDKESISEAIQFETMFNIIHEKSGFKVDFIIRKDVPYREIEFQRRRTLDLDGTPVWVVSSEDLILSKLYWAKDSFSQLQIGDIRRLMTTVKNLDMAYIHQWIGRLGLSAIFAKIEAP